VLCAAIASRAIFSLIHLDVGVQWISWLPGPGTWSDYAEIYVPQLKLLASGYMLYRDIDTQYPPLFLYSMLSLYDLAGSKAAWIPIVLADASTAPIIYLIVRRFSTTKIALLAGLGYAFSPVALVNEGYLWLSSQPMTFFLMLSILLLNKGRPVWSAGTLAIAALFSQEALFVLPAYLPFVAAKFRNSLPKAGGLFALTFFGVLAPFLAQAPKAVLHHLPFWEPFNIGPSEPSRLPTPPPSAAVVQTCANTLVPNANTATACGSIVNFQAYAQYTQIARIDAMAAFVAPFLFVLFAVGLVAVRRSPNILELVCAYSFIGGLFIFSALVHPVLAYYFVPVYALILASVTNGRSLLVGLAAVTLGFLAGEGPFQFIIPVACIFAFTLIQDSRSRTLASEPTEP
jgi:hypothetical protein